jgi:hypothetical protein
MSTTGAAARKLPRRPGVVSLKRDDAVNGFGLGHDGRTPPFPNLTFLIVCIDKR